MTRVLMPIAEGFEELEALNLIETLPDAGQRDKVAGGLVLQHWQGSTNEPRSKE